MIPLLTPLANDSLAVLLEHEQTSSTVCREAAFHSITHLPLLPANPQLVERAQAGEDTAA